MQKLYSYLVKNQQRLSSFYVALDYRLRAIYYNNVDTSDYAFSFHVIIISFGEIYCCG